MKKTKLHKKRAHYLINLLKIYFKQPVSSSPFVLRLLDLNLCWVWPNRLLQRILVAVKSMHQLANQRTDRCGVL